MYPIAYQDHPIFRANISVDVLEELARLVLFAHKLLTTVEVDIICKTHTLLADLRKTSIVRSRPSQFIAGLKL